MESSKKGISDSIGAQTSVNSRQLTSLPSIDDCGVDNLDEAFKYLHDHNDAGSEGVNIPALRRKIDWHIVPIMFACYVLQFLDKVVINVGLLLAAVTSHI